MNLSLRAILGDYEEPETINVPGLRKDVPIEKPQRLGWKQLEDPNRLTRMFKFDVEEKMNAFIMDVLEHQSESGHHGRITIQSPSVKIDVWTHTLNDITEVDLEWAKAVNEIFEGYDQ
jgi:pterin-4a-carbinolamine dehydratase